MTRIIPIIAIVFCVAVGITAGLGTALVLIGADNRAILFCNILDSCNGYHPPTEADRRFGCTYEQTDLESGECK